MEKNTEEVRELCARIIAEKDADKLAELVTDLDEVLAVREEKLRKGQSEPATERRTGT
jgi:hypothetical protein